MLNLMLLFLLLRFLPLTVVGQSEMKKKDICDVDASSMLMAMMMMVTGQYYRPVLLALLNSC